jgi:hypothetical protein
MATRSSTSEFQPSPPNVRLGGKQNGRFSAGTVVRTINSNPGIKPNMCCAPATNGDRASGLAASQPNSARAMKGMTPRLSR